MTLVRGEVAAEVLERGDLLDCARCGVRYESDDLDALMEDYGDPACLECKCQGFVPRSGRQTISDRFPAGIGAWSPVPHALLEHGGDLGLSANDRLVVLALEIHRRRRDDVVWPSVMRLAKLTGLSTSTVKRTLKRLCDGQGDGVRRERKRDARGRVGKTYYDLEPLWQAASAAAQGHSDPWSRDHLDPRPEVTVHPEVEAVEDQNQNRTRAGKPAAASAPQSVLSDLWAEDWFDVPDPGLTDETGATA